MKNVRICVLNYQQQNVESYEEWSDHLISCIDVASENGSDFIVFPEFVTIPLLSLEKSKLNADESLTKLSSYTEKFLALMKHEALQKKINIIGGTHLLFDDQGLIKNVCHLFTRQGDIFKQEKIHPTPNEQIAWKVKGGNELKVFDTDCGKIGIQICYDCEFPELSRKQIKEGAQILFVPYSTDTRHGHLRVRICAQARTIENQCYVALSGNVGHLKNVFNADISYAQSCILTPSDFFFDRDGIAADTEANIPMFAFADLDLEKLSFARKQGSVQNLKDRRLDLYQVNWSGK